MAARCANDNDNRVANSNSVGTGTDFSTRTSVFDRLPEEILEEATAISERALKEAELEQAAAASETPIYETLTSGTRKLARTVGKFAEKLMNLAGDPMQRKKDAWYEAVKLVDGSNQIDATLWMNFQNSMSKFFVNDRADLVTWLNTVANFEGKKAVENPLVQEQQQMIPKIRGLMNIFSQRHAKLMDTLNEASLRTGIDRDVLALMGGNYLNALHTPERNEHLFKLWERRIEEAGQELAILQATIENPTVSEKNRIKALKGERTKYENRMREWRAELENPNPEVRHGGYTNAEARILMDEMQRMSGMTHEELRAFSRRLSDEFSYITQELATAGVVPKEQLEAIPDFEWYAPQFSQKQNLNFVANDATPYVPGSRRAMDGMTEKPDSAFTSLGFAARRAATEIGMQDFGTKLAAVQRKLQRMKDADKNYTLPLLSVDDNAISAMLESRDPAKEMAAVAIRQNKGMIVNVPMRLKDGTIKLSRRFMYFNPAYKEGTLTGAALNEALISEYKTGSRFIDAIKTTTSYAGQSYTRFSPGFAPVGMMRDLGERAMHLTNRDYIKEDGTELSGASIVGKYMRNSVRAGKMLYSVMRGKAGEGTEAYRLFDEYRREGLFQKFTPGVRQEPQTLEQLALKHGKLTENLRDWKAEGAANWLEKRQFTPFKKALAAAGIGGRSAMRVIDGWNDWLQNVAAFSHYMTLRENGVSAKNAAFGVREIMDMSQSGQIAHHLAVIAPFVRPTMQGAAAFARTMGLNAANPKDIFKEGKRGWIAGLAATIGFSVLYPLVRESLGADDDGNMRMDSLPISRLTNWLPIGINDEGSYVKLPLGFGPVRVASALSLAMDRVYRGQMDVSDAAFEVLFAAARDSVPGNNPMFNFGDNPSAFIAQYICPVALRPMMEIATNTTAFGGRVHKATMSEDKAAADQGFDTTPGIWHQIARYIHQTTGADYAPEDYRTMAKGLSFGPLRLITSGIVDFAERGATRKGFHKPTAMEELPPALATLGGTMWYGKFRGVSQQYYYEAYDELSKKAKRAGVSLTSDGKKGEEGAEILRQKLTAAGFEKEEADDLILLRETRKELLKLGKAFHDKHPHWYDEEDATDLKQDFERLATDSDILYANFVKNANYYANRR